LPKEEDTSVHVNRPNERDQFKEEKSRLEWEEEGASLENRVQRVAYCPTNQVVGILNILEDISIKLMVVKQIRLHLRKAHL
jgi:hypothetical protein